MSYKKETIKGISWVGSFRVVTRGMSFARTAVLARLLTPAQFGVYGIALLVLALLEVFTETGINVFLIQEKSKIDKYIDTAWVISIFRGFIISGVILLSIPFVVWFFKTPEARDILIIISMVPIVRGFINPSVVSFQKDLRFSKDFVFQTSRFGVDTVVAILLAFLLKSETALAWGLLAGTFFEVVLSFVLVNPRPKLKVNFKYAKKILHSGKWVTSAGIFDYLSQNTDDAAVGRILGTSSLGFYQMAYKLSTLPLKEITQVVGRVTFPVYVKIENPHRMRLAFKKALFAVSGLSFVASVGLFLFADPIVKIVLGPGWEPVVPLLQVLAVFGFIRAVVGVFHALFLALKKQSWVATVSLIELVSLLIVILPLIATFGLVGAGYAAIISAIVPIPFVIYYYRKSFSHK